MRQYTLFLLLFFSFALPVAAREPGTTRLAERWSRADRDGDGSLDRREATSIKMVWRNFEAMDRDGDQRVSVEEVRAWRAAKAKRRRAPAMSASEALIARADRNGDGAIDRAEAQAAYPRLAERFALIDADGDGKLDAAETGQWLAERRAFRSRAK